MQTIELKRIEALTPYRRNARTHSKTQIRQIADSIRRFGFVNPVLVDDGGGIIAGHGRVEAARLLGLAEVPTLRLSHLGEAEKRALILADNRLAEKAGWDENLLAIELNSLVELDFEVELTGFETAEIELLMSDHRETRSDAVAESPEGGAGGRDARGPTHRTAAFQAALAEPDDGEDASRDRLAVSRPGDLWILGEHRLSCGSAAAAEDYLHIDAAIRHWQACAGATAKLAATSEAFGEIEARLSENAASGAETQR